MCIIWWGDSLRSTWKPLTPMCSWGWEHQSAGCHSQTRGCTRALDASVHQRLRVTADCGSQPQGTSESRALVCPWGWEQQSADLHSQPRGCIKALDSKCWEQSWLVWYLPMGAQEPLNHQYGATGIWTLFPLSCLLLCMCCMAGSAIVGTVHQIARHL